MFAAHTPLFERASQRRSYRVDPRDKGQQNRRDDIAANGPAVGATTAIAVPNKMEGSLWLITTTP
jgi:hypothetical protein